eukprot:CFRG7063T1
MKFTILSITICFLISLFDVHGRSTDEGMMGKRPNVLTVKAVYLPTENTRGNTKARVALFSGTATGTRDKVKAHSARRIALVSPSIMPSEREDFRMDAIKLVGYVN